MVKYLDFPLGAEFDQLPEIFKVSEGPDHVKFKTGHKGTIVANFIDIYSIGINILIAFWTIGTIGSYPRTKAPIVSIS